MGVMQLCFFSASHKKKQRDQLSVWVQEQIEELGPNHQDEELLQTEQCLHEVRTTKLLVLCRNCIFSVFVFIMLFSPRIQRRLFLKQFHLTLLELAFLWLANWRKRFRWVLVMFSDWTIGDDNILGFWNLSVSSPTIDWARNFPRRCCLVTCRIILDGDKLTWLFLIGQ